MKSGIFCLMMASVLIAAEPVTKTPLPISEETTIFTEPLREDGSVDYVAAFNALRSKGVTPVNNIAAAVVRTIGPNTQALPTKRLEQICRQLGIETPSADGQYLVEFDEYIDLKFPQLDSRKRKRRVKKLSDQFASAGVHFWTKKDHPLLSDWLEENDAVLNKLFVELANRDQYYEPLQPESADQPAMLSDLMIIPRVRKLVQTLNVRVLRHCGAGDFETASEELFLMLKFIRCMGAKSDFLTEKLILDGVEYIVSDSISELLHSARFNYSQWQSLLQKYKTLPARRSLSHLMNVGKRATELDIVRLLARVPKTSFKLMEDFTSLDFGDQIDARTKQQLGNQVEWSKVLKSTNDRLDRYVELAQSEDYRSASKRAEAITAADQQTTKRLQAEMDVLRTNIRIGKINQNTTRMVSDALSLVSSVPPEMLIETEFNALANERFLKLGFAIATFRAKHDRLPIKLSELSPDYLKTVPVDPYSGTAFHYTSNASGYRIWSVGPNLRDDNGRTRYEQHTKGAEGSDDLRFAVPRRTNVE